MRILAVDDDQNIRDLLKTALDSQGKHDLVLAESGADALSILRVDDAPFDVFLLDIQMPEMDGIELIGHLRHMERYASTPILMLTAMSEKKFIDRAFQAGATDYVTKPFEFLDLFARLKTAERLVDQACQVRESARALDDLQADLARSFEHSLSEPFEVANVDRVTGYVSFENYLLQMSRMKALTTSVFAIKMLNVEKLFETMSSVDFRRTIGDVAEHLSKIYGEDADLITYRGDGIFVCATAAKTAYSQFGLERRMNCRLQQSGVGGRSDLAVQVSAGEAITLLSFTRSGALRLLQNAVAKAEKRAETYCKILHMSDSVLQSRGVTEPVMNQMDAQAPYKAMLEESMRESDRIAS